MVNADEQGLIAYIDGEVRAVCESKGWGHQVRRNWSVREKPVSESTIADYEWKLIPGAHGKLLEAGGDDFEGVYYVVSFDNLNGRFVVQHDTGHCGVMGPHWEVTTYSEIRPNVLRSPVSGEGDNTTPAHPPVGWLRDHLLRLTARFEPNTFSVT